MAITANMAIIFIQVLINYFIDFFEPGCCATISFVPANGGALVRSVRY
jgi:hypothetical protein